MAFSPHPLLRFTYMTCITCLRYYSAYAAEMLVGTFSFASRSAGYGCSGPPLPFDIHMGVFRLCFCSRDSLVVALACRTAFFPYCGNVLRDCYASASPSFVLIPCLRCRSLGFLALSVHDRPRSVSSCSIRSWLSVCFAYTCSGSVLSRSRSPLQRSFGLWLVV